MNIECIFLAIPLIFLGLLINSSGFAGNPESSIQNQAISQKSCPSPAVQCTARGDNISESRSLSEEAASGSDNKISSYLFTNIVTGIGAGIYEELVFRLILISGFMIFFQDLLRFGKLESVILSVILSALLFSLHHNIDFISGQVNSSEPFQLPKFVFRTLAGVYFAVIFAIRRFGVTAGTHAFYNIIAVITNAAFFGG
jgi:membrane protease YdiL (CAAX protease family)